LTTSRTIRVALGRRSYDVRVGPGLLGQLGEAVAALGEVRQAVVIADAAVGDLYAAQAADALRGAGLDAPLLTFPAGEANKTLAVWGRLFDELFALAPPVDRRTVVVALGGGVTGDLAGFLAATALRGLRWVQCPTTLLADVDASVGGKTAVDHPAGKNLIGAFHQPAGVLADVTLLRSLPAAEVGNGLAECVKHAVIRDATLLEFLEDAAEAVLACEPDAMGELVARNVAIKAAVVSADEREAGVRAHLNFGHTIGHAIEACVGYENIAHGQAVSLGMVAACRMAVARGLIEPEAGARVEGLLAALGLPVRWAGLDAERIWQIMLHDKKTRGGQVRMVLPVVLGEVALFGDITPAGVRQAVAGLGGGA
jgi:3-dehydroquinate synthase